MSLLVTALSIGSIYVLVALAYDVIYITTNVFNFAQGGIIAVSGLLAYSAIADWGLGVLGAAVLCAALGVVLTVVQWAVSVLPLTFRGRDTEIWLVSTLGAFVMIEAGGQLIWGSEAVGAEIPALDHLVSLGDGSVKVAAFVAIGAAIVATVGLDLWYGRSRYGKVFRATAADEDAAELRGIDTRKVAAASFAMAGVIAGLAGLILLPITFARADLGSLLVIKAFVAMAIGGFGSVRGALIGGWSIGLVEVYGADLVGVQYESILVFLVLVTVLLVLPRGIFGAPEGRQV
jgi:branched-chain amino acid transport system permease protein